jgi:hypothetical protein
MTPEEIRKNAPDGATHYKDYNGFISYYKFGHRHSFFWNIDYWSATYINILLFAEPL